MDTGIDKAKLLRYKALVVKHLSDPVKLRLAIVAATVSLAVGAGYMPLAGRIERDRIRLRATKSRLASIHEVEGLRRVVGAYRPRLGEGLDTNEWVQYILGGLRVSNVRLRDMESKKPQKVGPYQTVTLSLEVAGTYAKLKGFVEWLEASDRLLRVDVVRIEKQPGNLLMKVVVLGLIRKNASTS